MAISTDYPIPVTVNGFSCRNCTDMARAEKNIDPADPAAGPFGVNRPRSETSAKAALVGADKKLFDRDRIDAIIAARQQTADQAQEAAASTGYGATQNGVPVGQLVNLSA